jgi:hypothetical protein
MQRERAKFKELLSNTQNELLTTKNQVEKESESKTRQDFSYQEILEEKSRLITA